ncbi:MAG TPA: hypothetical protein VGR26_13390 [Acidimicrobiales bacterium]|nr:hypothetical protein [Acidimicrobiales bacterium]
MRLLPHLHARRRVASTVLALAMASTGLVSCREGTVRLTFRPEAGTTYRYEVEVRTVSEVRMGTGAPEIREEDVVLTAEHTVLRAGEDGVEVRVLLQEPGGPERVFEVVFDRAAQLEEVQSIEGVPDDRLGTLGISEIFPAAAGAPPDRPLAPGASWIIDDAIQLPDGSAAATELTGSGRLVELAVVEGVEVARLASAARLPLESMQASPAGSLHLSGSQVTEYAATHDLDDGAVREATSNTVGNFDLEIGPPLGFDSEPVSGTLRVEVSSSTRLIE